jgi:dTDP-4-dehydrorhamnose 3,5-epimerase
MPATAETQDVGIQGVHLVPLVTHGDDRGSVTEDYRRSWIPEMGEMVQGNVSFSRAGVLRGMHFHLRQADWWTFYTGSAVIGLFDLRSGSPTERKKAHIQIRAAEGLRGLYIPRGVAHGFYAESDLILHYLVDNYYTGQDEFGVQWNDPEMNLDWPTSSPVISERDMKNPGLAQALVDPPPFEP